MNSKRTPSCGSPCGDDDRPEHPFYVIDKPKGQRVPTTVAGLERVLLNWSKPFDGKWSGKMYVARTISLDEESRQFKQSGCGPNYRGGLWSMTTCKHGMRGSKCFKDQVRDGQVATVILTLSSVSPVDHRQYLVSAARITQSYKTMQDYYVGLCKLRSKATLAEKMSTGRRIGAALGYRFGDCHVDGRGAIRPPTTPHVHFGGNADRDLAGNHRLLISTEYLVWDCPTIWSRNLIRQSRYGINVDGDNLHELLADT